jgi:inositol-phosphate transport system permease protein
MIGGNLSKAFLFLLPALLLTAVFFIAPAIMTGGMSLTGLDYRFVWEWVGVENYVRMARDTLVPKILLNTGVYTFGTLALFNVMFGLLLALSTSYIEDRAGLFFRAVWLLPRFTPPVVYAVVWFWILDPTDYGLLNTIRQAIGFQSVDWISSYPWGTIIVTNGIIGASMGMVIFAAAIESIPDDYLRASRVDGASWFGQVRYVILPMIRWPLLFITAYQTLSLLTSYEYILLITRGGPFYASEVWSLYAYDVAFSTYSGTFQFGYGAALATVLVIIGIVASVVYWRGFRFHGLMETPRIEVA